MNLRNLSILVAALLLSMFTLLNWSAFVTPTTLSLGVADVQAPLGLIMLGVTAVVSGLFLFYILFQQASVILESRRTAKELHTQRELADKAEASRFTEMRVFLEAELRRLETQASASADALNERIDRTERALSELIAESTRTLSAYVGEVDDKLNRVHGLPPAE